jgi:lysophospholipase L1-like esterase
MNPSHSISASEEAMKQDQQIRIGCIGDSITAGTGLADREEAFPARLERLLSGRVTVLNFGDGGKTMRNDLGVDAYVNSDTYQRLMQTADRLDIVTIMLGTNDAYHAKGWTDGEKEAFRNDCRRLFAALSEKNPSMVFVLMNSPACFGSAHTRYDMIPLRALQSTLAAELNQAGYRTEFLDMYAVTKPLGDHFPDQLHPDKTAHQTMAEALSRVICTLLP